MPDPTHAISVSVLAGDTATLALALDLSAVTPAGAAAFLSEVADLLAAELDAQADYGLGHRSEAAQSLPQRPEGCTGPVAIKYLDAETPFKICCGAASHCVLVDGAPISDEVDG